MSLNNPGFFERVYKVVACVPYGRVTSYGAIARFLGSGRSARMVGYAMNNSHLINGIPAHRVLNRNGMLTGKHHFGGAQVMEQLLRSEGISVLDDKVVDFETIFWDPSLVLKHDDFR